jgi:hypothetical protein
MNIPIVLEHPEGIEAFEDFVVRTNWIFEPEARSTDGAGPWRPRKPIVAELKPVAAFDPDALLPDSLRPWIIDEAERMPCPPDYVAATAIVEAGAIIGARCAIRPKSLDPWSLVPNLWGGVVGDPSDKKSPAMTTALKPMDRLICGS